MKFIKMIINLIIKIMYIIIVPSDKFFRYITIVNCVMAKAMPLKFKTIQMNNKQPKFIIYEKKITLA